jgi:uncharacterized protein (DUF697 family)
MKLFERKSTWDRLLESALSKAASVGTRQAGKVTLTVVGGAVAATIASAAVSSLRREDDS